MEPWIRKNTAPTRVLASNSKIYTLPSELSLSAKDINSIIEEAIAFDEPSMDEIINLCSPEKKPSILFNHLSKFEQKSCIKNTSSSTMQAGAAILACVTPPEPQHSNKTTSCKKELSFQSKDEDTSDTSIASTPQKKQPKKKLKLKNCDQFFCRYVIKKGVRKGSSCNSLSCKNSEYCSLHTKKVNLIAASSYHVEPIKSFQTPSTFKKLKINKLLFNRKYHFVGSVNPDKLFLKLNGDFVCIRIPKYMRQTDYTDHYLIRDQSSKITSWRKE